MQGTFQPRQLPAKHKCHKPHNTTLRRNYINVQTREETPHIRYCQFPATFLLEGTKKKETAYNFNFYTFPVTKLPLLSDTWVLTP